MENIVRELKEKIIGNGNYLFRSFAYFLYNDQEKHRFLRLKIASNVLDNWKFYELFLIGESHIIRIEDRDSYNHFMSTNGTFGGEVEIKSFVDIYEIHVRIEHRNVATVREFGENLANSNHKLTLFLSSEVDIGHYDVKDCLNLNFSKDYQPYYNRVYYEKNNHSTKYKRVKAQNADSTTLERKRQEDLVRNMDENRLKKEPVKDRVEKISSERLEKKR